MRVISGCLHGRTIKVPKSKLVRPTTDKVRESLFNILQNRIDFDDISVLDIYAGSGSLGIESFSRGASPVHFVEKNFQIYKNLINNLNALGIEKECKVFKMEAVKFTVTPRNERYDLILADPPFFKDDIHKVVVNILNNGFLNANGILIIERSIQTKEKDEAAFGIEAFKRIGDSLIYQIR